MNEKTCVDEYEEEMNRITSLGVVNKDEAEYYIACMKTACRIVNISNISSTTTPYTLVAAVFSKISKNISQIRRNYEYL